MRSYSADTLKISNGYQLALTWDEKRGALNQSSVYHALSDSDGLLDPSFTRETETLARLSRRIDAALDLAALVREVEVGKGPSPVELWSRAAKLMGLRESSIIESAVEIPLTEIPDFSATDKADAGLADQGASPHDSKLDSSSTPVTPAATSPDLLDLASRVLAGRLDRDDRVKIFEGVRRDVLETSHKVALIDADLRQLLRTSASFVKHSPLYECECGPLGHEVDSTCPLCESKARANPHSICTIQPDISQVMDDAVWFELGVARLFDACGFTTYVGSFPIGLSGGKHEVDIIAWDPSQKLLVIAETTTDSASMNRMARVLLRATDIRAHAAVLVSLGEAEEDVVSFGRRHSIAVIPRIRENTDQLKRWIQSTRGAIGTHPRS
jgi:hypothetical protein